jgi:hypothetical protein
MTMMSPGTMSVAGILRRSPSRMTVAWQPTRAKGSHSGLRPRLLHVAHRGIDQHDQKMAIACTAMPRRAHRPTNGRDCRRDEQQDDEHILELLQSRRHAGSGFRYEFVAPMLPEARLPRCRWTALHAGPERRDDIIDRLTV